MLSSFISRKSFCVIVLFAGLVTRALLLEYTDLHDPTEARYAIVAQEMFLSGDWLTPKLPMPNGIEPYLGKPPLHFWLTAISYSLFGMDEWTSRAPSFILATLLLYAVYRFSKELFGKDTGTASALILLSSPLFYFISGASVTDMTLTTLTSLGVIFLYKFITNPVSKPVSLYSAAICAALAFLTKGPIGIILIGLPFLVWSAVKKDFSWIRRIYWIRCSLIFLAIAAPWFLLNEQKNPGFLEYFFLNENFGRFLLKDYGDRYGSGHCHFFGMSWLMLIGGFLPWSLVIAGAIAKSGLRSSWRWLKEHDSVLFIFSWAICSASFFTFARQLHFLYILPSIPGFSILTARILAPVYLKHREPINKPLFKLFPLLWILTLSGALYLKFWLVALILGFVVLVLGYWLFKTGLKKPSGVEIVGCFAAPLLTTYLLAIISFSPYLDTAHSTEDAIKSILIQEENNDHLHRIGVITQNTFSHYWLAKAWKHELTEAVSIEYVPREKISESSVCFLMIPRKEYPQISASLIASFDQLEAVGEWIILRHKVSHG